MYSQTTTHRIRFLRHLFWVLMRDVPHYHISKLVKGLQIFCYYPADNNRPISDKICHNIIVRQEFCKLNITDWFLAGKPVKLWVLDSIKHSKLMCPVDGAVAMLLRLDSGMDFIIDVVSHQSIFSFTKLYSLLIISHYSYKVNKRRVYYM